ncbi:2-oxoglutarate ferredoxin oxidoreductase subunit alpha [Acetoanaerobium pronyense]|uniref:2-oxoglutarate ferredoxin oxidoreductase subunit alpha n=1 Tax=Acetoanaerobium pronyense TaxID=1482736 RepID=A0ABS4KKA7_9FIRM|nr:2-oxoacid:acceptor oxidoreductase subunit alpha [Acetoanaerobium pronyense]MBP2028190.1 2-oxoglutarate ferredoxin oxidoreductase subunit alpha [Acetoanaerobium pronyense]
MGRKIKLLQGNEACVHGALYAGMDFFAGYPITPSTEIAEVSSEMLPRIGGKFIQMEDEIAGMATTIGAAIAGAKAMTATSGPGFSLKQENLGYAAITETPCVVVNVQRSGPSTGLPTSPAQGDYMQAKWGTHGDHPVIALSPTSVAETFELTVKAFNFSEKYRMPVILLMDELIGHLREKIEIPEPGELEVIPRKLPTVSPEEFKAFEYTEDLVPPMANFGMGYRYNVTGLFHDETGFPTNNTDEAERLLNRLMAKIDNNLDDILIYEEINAQDADVLLVSFGGMVRASKEAMATLKEKGYNVGLFAPKTVWPFPSARLNELSQNKKFIFVVEMNLGQMIEPVMLAAQNKDIVKGINKANGEIITPEQIVEKCLEVI